MDVYFPTLSIFPTPTQKRSTQSPPLLFMVNFINVWESWGLSKSQAISLSSCLWYDECIPADLSPSHSLTHKPELLNCFCKIICPYFSLYLLWELSGHDHLGNKKMGRCWEWRRRGEGRMHREIWGIQKELSRGILYRPIWEKTDWHGKRVAGAKDEPCS